jgi:hypothetical protein
MLGTVWNSDPMPWPQYVLTTCSVCVSTVSCTRSIAVSKAAHERCAVAKRSQRQHACKSTAAAAATASIITVATAVTVTTTATARSLRGSTAAHLPVACCEQAAKLLLLLQLDDGMLDKCTPL